MNFFRRKQIIINQRNVLIQSIIWVRIKKKMQLTFNESVDMLTVSGVFWADAKLSHLFFFDFGSTFVSSDIVLINLRSKKDCSNLISYIIECQKI